MAAAGNCGPAFFFPGIPAQGKRPNSLFPVPICLHDARSIRAMDNPPRKVGDNTTTLDAACGVWSLSSVRGMIPTNYLPPLATAVCPNEKARWSSMGASVMAMPRPGRNAAPGLCRSPSSVRHHKKQKRVSLPRRNGYGEKPPRDDRLCDGARRFLCRGEGFRRR